MRIARIETNDGRRSWALIDPDKGLVHCLQGRFGEWAPRAASGSRDLPLQSPALNLSEVRLLAPLEPGARILGVGMNYLSHLAKLGRKDPPPHTLAFIKPESALVNPGGQIRYPVTTAQLDFEIELIAVVARELGAEPQATSCLLGYTIGNDISARDAGKQLNVMDLFGHKSLDASAPVGPWITTLDEFGGAGQPEVNIIMRVNGEVRQRDNTRNMIFTLDELLNFVDIRVALRAGDLLFTGTTCGVGLEDGRFLRPGDQLESEVERIGVLRNSVGPKHQPPAARLQGRVGLPA
jgi:2-keto-4-pentenoate hydratase/2-oxohepta-3-ene-1,7-dioic acid hydratase in catechol pathway